VRYLEAGRFPNYLRAWRKSRRKPDGTLLTQGDVAIFAGVSKPTISRIENGSQNYNARILEAYATLCGCQPGDLLSREPFDPDTIYQLYARLRPAQRSEAEAILRAMVNGTWVRPNRNNNNSGNPGPKPGTRRRA